MKCSRSAVADHGFILIFSNGPLGILSLKQEFCHQILVDIGRDLASKKYDIDPTTATSLH